MKESEYILVSNLQRLNLASHALSQVLFGEQDPRRKKVTAALRQVMKLTEEIYAEIQGTVEEDDN